MEKLVWEQSFSVGVSFLDEQHKKLINMINTLIEMRAVSVDSEAMSNVLADMIGYAENHFKSEEQYLLKFGYPGYQEQKAEHIEFIEKAVTFCMGTMEHKATIPTETIFYLRGWWVNHILKSDMLYKKFFEEKGL